MTLDISFSSPFAFPCECETDDPGCLTLTSSSSSEPFPSLHATTSVLLHDNHHSTIYAATLEHDQSPVVLKLAQGSQSFEDLKKEADHYASALKDVQGTAVPRFYGFYEWRCVTHSRRRLGCLVLEYCGEPVVGKFKDLPMNERLDILDVLADLHAHGMHHSDFSELNVVTQNGEYRLIDFTYLEKKHKCFFDNQWKAGAHVKDVGSMGCGMLKDAAYHMNIWDNPLANPEPPVEIGGQTWPGEHFPPQVIIDQLVVEEYMNEFFNENKLRGWLHDVRRYMDANPDLSDSEIVEFGRAKEGEIGMAKNWEESEYMVRKRQAAANL
ncbi:hypothetical protein FPV67DRAFT_1728608 [Lyophyllum atratum]|nr:hypothetical protein FPV67DRAFT_1728608 [Lyophyllum atratum]